MKHSLGKYLEDILLSVGDIEEYTTNLNKISELIENKILFDALCRRFAIIGEASFKANQLDKNLPITEKAKIIGLRHIILHDYDKVRPENIWIIIKNK
jgi:uncharacterized protein with HEPN domain